MTKSPAFQFYPDDFVGSGKVGTMTTEEVGVYVLLLCLDWSETGFVYDEDELARWCKLPRAKFRKAWARVSRCFVARDGRLFNPRLEAERTKQADWREKARKGGLASGEARAKGSSTVVQPKANGSSTVVGRVVELPTQLNGNTPSPSPTPVTATAKESVAVAPVIVKGPKPKRLPTPWMGRLNATWKRHMGGDLPPGSATQLTPVVADVGEVEADTRLDAYLDRTDPEFVSIRTFCAKHGTYGDTLGVDPATGTLNGAGMKALGIGR